MKGSLEEDEFDGLTPVGLRLRRSGEEQWDWRAVVKADVALCFVARETEDGLCFLVEKFQFRSLSFRFLSKNEYYKECNVISNKKLLNMSGLRDLNYYCE